MRRICVVNDYDGLYGKFWGNLGQVVRPYTTFLKDPTSFDLVCFTGGEDVSPELYGHRNLASGNSVERDAHEKRFFEVALEHGIAMTGICRGAQFLNVLSGGTMVQHLRKDHGGGRHKAITFNEQVFQVTSSHHQMIVPGAGGRVLSWADEMLPLSSMVYDGDLEAALTAVGSVVPERKMALVTEAVYYPTNKIFGVQHHPEWQDLEEEAPQWTLRMIRELLLGEKSASIS